MCKDMHERMHETVCACHVTEKMAYDRITHLAGRTHEPMTHP